MKPNHPAPVQKHSTSIDWTEIKRKVASLQKVIEQKEILLPDEKRLLLKQRALALALRENDETGQQGRMEIIVFRLAFETYGIETAFVREVYPLKDITPLPGTPPFVVGIINVRGQIVSVIDLKKFFNLPEKGLGQLNKVIIIRNDRMEFGILADAVLGTRPIPADTLQGAPPTVTGIGAEYLKGVTREGVIVLDAEKILDDEKIVISQKAE